MDVLPVLFDVQRCSKGHAIGIATLNAEKSLNSLSLPMIDLLYTQLVAWQRDETIVVVVLQAAGDRAFCAGGDIQELYQSMLAHPADENPYARQFFEREYRLDYLLARYEKPVLAWGHGFVMGGGLGLMAASSHRVATPRTRLAMPEITIGLFPDAGATWFLSRMPRHWAHFMAWTGCQIGAMDARQLGLVDYLLEQGVKPVLMAELVGSAWSADVAHNHVLLDGLIRRLQNDRGFPPGEFDRHDQSVRSLVDASLSSANPALAFAEGLHQLDQADAWIARATAAFVAGCPTTACIVPRQIAAAALMTRKQMFMMELCLALQCARHGEFTEGVRALLIDRDNNPAWRYASIAAVPEAWVNEHFELPFAGENPLIDLPETADKVQPGRQG